MRDKFPPGWNSGAPSGRPFERGGQRGFGPGGPRGPKRGFGPGGPHGPRGPKRGLAGGPRFSPRGEGAFGAEGSDGGAFRGGPAGRFPRRGPGGFPPRGGRGPRGFSPGGGRGPRGFAPGGDRGPGGFPPRGDRGPGGFPPRGDRGPGGFGKPPFRAPYGASNFRPGNGGHFASDGGRFDRPFPGPRRQDDDAAFFGDELRPFRRGAPNRREGRFGGGFAGRPRSFDGSMHQRGFGDRPYGRRFDDNGAYGDAGGEDRGFRRGPRPPYGAGKPRRFEKRGIPVAPVTAPKNSRSLESTSPDVDPDALLVPTLPEGFAVEALPVDVPIVEATDGTAAPVEAAASAQPADFEPEPMADLRSAETAGAAPEASASDATESVSPSADDTETAAFDKTAMAAEPFAEPEKMRSKPPVVVERKRPRPPKSGARGGKPFQLWQRPPLELQTTTLWDYPSQHYGIGEQGSKHYKGATPSYIIWNLLERYTAPNDTVVDPMCGSGTTLDVCRDTGRKGIGFDLAPFREDIQPADARAIPLADESVSFVFVDPPYSTHLEYSNDDKCIGRLDAADGAYYDAMETVFAQMARILKPGGHAALYVSDSFKKGKPFQSIGFELFARMRRYLEPVDIVAVTRHNKSLKLGNWHRAAAEGNFFLRGFNYLFIFRKPDGAAGAR